MNKILVIILLIFCIYDVGITFYHQKQQTQWEEALLNWQETVEQRQKDVEMMQEKAKNCQDVSYKISSVEQQIAACEKRIQDLDELVSIRRKETISTKPSSTGQPMSIPQWAMTWKNTPYNERIKKSIAALLAVNSTLRNDRSLNDKAINLEACVSEATKGEESAMFKSLAQCMTACVIILQYAE